MVEVFGTCFRLMNGREGGEKEEVPAAPYLRFCLLIKEKRIDERERKRPAPVHDDQSVSKRGRAVGNVTAWEPPAAMAVAAVTRRATKQEHYQNHTKKRRRRQVFQKQSPWEPRTLHLVLERRTRTSSLSATDTRLLSPSGGHPHAHRQNASPKRLKPRRVLYL